MRTIRSILILAATASTFAGPALAAFTLPTHVFRMDRLADATETARDKEMPIAFLYTDERTNCGLCKAASLDAAQELKDHAVIVYLDSENDAEWRQAPGPVRRALNSPESGRYVPKVVIVGPDGKSVRFIVPYVGDPEARKRTLGKVRSLLRE